MKRILTIQDISGVGKCSLTVALPIISAMGVECAVMPTAVLSAHTCFPHYTFRDLTADLIPMAERWYADGITFDAIYTGYISSPEQLAIVQHVIECLKTPHTTLLVDPVMADNGHFYARFDATFAKAMRQFCQKATIITPNLSEATLLLGQPIQTTPYTPETLKPLLKALADLGPQIVVVTGVSLTPAEIGIAIYTRATDELILNQHPRVPGLYHGTGDIFASTAIGALMRGYSAKDAFALAEYITYRSIQLSYQTPDAVPYGVAFERALPELITLLVQPTDHAPSSAQQLS